MSPGDEFLEGPHIYTTEFRDPMGPFRGYYGGWLRGLDQRQAEPYEETRVEKFARKEKK
jgi:hypothetical protein